MDFGKVASNPLVWAGGAAIGLFLLISKSGGSAPASGVTGYTAGELSATTAYNAMAFKSVEAQAANATKLGVAAINADVSKQGQFLSYLKSMNDNASVIQSQRITSASGIAQSQISSYTAIQLDQQQNSNRLQMGWIEADVQKTSIEAQLEGAKYQARYGAKAAKYGAIGQAVSTVANTAIKAYAGGK